jgi:AbrB family looped-hinge helix DNA binding protein
MIAIKIGKAGRGQIPIDVRRKMDIKEGDVLVVEIKEILKMEVPA